jgi:hypothetical protein
MDRKEYAGVLGFFRAPHGDLPPTGTFGGLIRRRGYKPTPSELKNLIGLYQPIAGFIPWG